MTTLETISRWLAQKPKKSLFEPPFKALRGNVRTPSMACWKARGRLPIRHDQTFFAISFGWDVISGNLSKSACLEGRWVILSANFRRMGASPTNHCCCHKLELLSFRVVSKYPQCIYWFCTARVCQTDGRTDRRTEKITTANTALAAARAVKTVH